MTKIVGIIGVAGAGKDTLAGYLTHLLEWYGMKVKTFSFAWAVREITERVGLPIYDRELKEKQHGITSGWQDRFQDAIDELLGPYVSDPEHCLNLYARTTIALTAAGFYSRDGGLYCSPRQFAQILGTEGGRGISEDFWVDILVAKIAAEASDVALVPDTRFVNEAQKCNLLLPVGNPRAALVNDHPSEQLARQMGQRGGFNHALLHIPTMFVDNGGSLDALKAQAANISTVLFRDAEVQA